MKGSNFANPNGNFGTMGVPSPSNVPPPLYEVASWTDKQGNFWIYGGQDTVFSIYAALWKYDPSANIWTWIKGTTAINALGVYGTKGVPSLTNAPPCKSHGVATWVDFYGNLWMFGGFGKSTSGVTSYQNDLWKYEIATNTWTWMSGLDGSGSGGGGGVYGTIGIANPANYPAIRFEQNATWVDKQGNLWLFGGLGIGGDYNDLWKYDVETNEWTWMHGSNVWNSPGNYGIKGIASATNDPPSRQPYAKWTDKDGNFWMFGGRHYYLSVVSNYNDLWKYEILTNMWTWVGGANTVDSAGSYGTICNPDSITEPSARGETKACWTDNCGNFWMFAGTKNIYTEAYNDMWYYDVATNQWTWVNGTNISSDPGNWGTQGVSALSNLPSARMGASPFKDKNGAFWMFGGCLWPTQSYYNDMWKYIPDSACLNLNYCVVLPQAMWTADTIQGCAPLTVDFSEFSQNTTNVFWDFGDSTTSTSSNPTHVYNTPGIYSVTLISYNGIYADTLIMVNYVTVQDCYVPPIPPLYLFIPNVFTPDNDGINDLFSIISEGTKSFHCRIYNRWGMSVFDSSDKSVFWNGKIQNNGEFAVDGTYFYLIEVVDLSNKLSQHKGFLSLIRKL